MAKDKSNTVCEACLAFAPGQLDHMQIGGCLYDNNSNLYDDYGNDDYSDNKNNNDSDKEN